MYNPPQFAETRPEQLWPLVEQRAFGVLVVAGEDGPDAMLAPFEVDTTAQRLRCHAARPNLIWRTAQEKAEVLVLVLGNDHYITPKWYPSKAAHGSVVPTWNYELITLRGRAEVFEDAARLRAHLEALTRAHEGKLPRELGPGWEVGDAPQDYIERQMRGIVGIEIAVRNLEGKFKLSQNRAAEDRDGAIEGLQTLGTAAGDAMARAMRQALKKRK